MKNDCLYLSNIKECIEQIDDYTIDGKEVFLQTRMIQDAVIRKNNWHVIADAIVAKTDLPDAGTKLINRGKSWMNLMLFENQSTIQIVLEK